MCTVYVHIAYVQNANGRSWRNDIGRERRENEVRFLSRKQQLFIIYINDLADFCDDSFTESLLARPQTV